MQSKVSTAVTAVFLTIAGWTASVPAAGAATDPGVRGGGPGAGDPVPGLTADQMTLFKLGQVEFESTDANADGLGPRFNLDSCVGCHSQPTHGGSAPAVNPQVAIATAFGARNVVPTFLTANGPIREAHFKFTANGQRDGGVHSLFVISGRVDASGSAAGCNIAQEDFNTQFARGNVALRIPTPTYGTGLMENIPDSTLITNLASNASRKAALGIGGHFNRSGNDGTIARYGWKAQNVSLLLFSGEAYNVEMGITNEIFQVERDQNPNCQLAKTPNDVTGKEGIADADGTLSDIEKFAVYMRFLGAPIPSTTLPGGAASITHGKQVFADTGCSMCHTPTLMTATTTVAAFNNQPVNLYSDMALHHMGPNLADNIVQGAAAGDEFRTAPLWGIGKRIFFLHDGRTNDLMQAIQAHASGGNGGGPFNPNSRSPWGPSEANRVIANFNALPDASKQDLLNFLRSL